MPSENSPDATPPATPPASPPRPTPATSSTPIPAPPPIPGATPAVTPNPVTPLAPPREGLQRYLSIDLLRGLALFLNVFVHIFTDVFNLDPITSDLFGQPVAVLVVFIAIGYFGSFGSLFILISGTGNTVAMHRGLERGKPVRAVMSRQVVSGLILLVFSFLVEGFFQFYGYLGTIGALNGHAHDVTRIVWHAYTMTPVHCLAVSMIVTGGVYALMARGGGFRNYKRNVVVYAVLCVAIVALSQPVWDLCRLLGPPGFPNAHVGGAYPGDYKVFMPPPGATAAEYVLHFFLATCGGSNHPIFPYLAVMFVGNAVGITLVAAREAKDDPARQPNPRVPRYGMLAGLVVFGIGILCVPLLGVDFDAVLPVDAVGDITKIHDGRAAFWVPWWCFLLAGEIIVVFLLVRLVEYRGASATLARRTRFFRRFGIPAFSVYAWHRFWAIPVVVVVSALAGQPSWTEGSITGASFGWPLTIVTLVGTWALIGGLLKAWEKVGYAGGIEWMMATVAAGLGKNFRKSKGTRKADARWWEYGKMDVAALFYDARWIAIVPRDETYHARHADSRLARELALLGLFCGVLAPVALYLALRARATEGRNPKNRAATRLAIAGLVILAVLATVTALVTLDTLGIAL